MTDSFYQFSARSSKGIDIQMSDYKGKVVLVVNTATKCGLAPQFEGLEMLHQKYKDKGLVVLGFPCNQFSNQEPESNETMADTCQLNFGVTFQLFEKIDVNGDNTHPIFRYLKKSIWNLFGNKIKWNFTKFLIDSNGNVVKRYAPVTKPQSIEKEIKRLLNV